MSRKIATLIGAGIIGGATTNPMLADLASYWTMDQGSGNRLDSVGTRHMAPVVTIGSTTGKIGNCATASGAGNFLVYVNSELTSLTWSGGFTVAGWIYVPSAWSGRNTILAKSDNGVADWALYCNAQNAHRMLVNDSSSGSSTAASATNLSLDAWHFMAGRYNPSTKKAEFRLDAESWNLGGALTNDPANSRGQLRIANYINLYGSAYYDETGLWMAYKDDAFVDYLYNGGAGRTLNPT